MRKMTLGLLIVLLVFSISTFAVAEGITVKLDGEVQVYDQEPVIKGGSTLVPMRGIFESLGSTIDYDSTTKIVTAKKGDITIELTIGKSSAIINGEIVELSQKEQVINGRTMVPLRFVSEALGADVNWDGETQTITISGKKYTEAKELERVVTLNKDFRELVLEGEDIQIMEQLLQDGADPNSLDSHGVHLINEYLKWAEPNPDALSIQSGYAIFQAMSQCVRHDTCEYLDILIEYGANVDAQHSYDARPIVAATIYNKVETVQMLLEKGADPIDENFVYRIADMDEEILHMLIDYGQPIDVDLVFEAFEKNV
jgi:hypothetical protein